MLTQTCKTNRVSAKMKVIYLALATLLLAVLFQLVSLSNASAATIIPDGTTCTLDEAVGAMNAGSDENGCTATGAYGTDDTIDIPAGTFGYSNTNTINVDLTVQGAGMGETIVDLGDSNAGFTLFSGAALTGEISDLSIQDPASANNTIYSEGFSMTVSRVEISSTNASAGGSGIVINNRSNGLTSTVQDIYIHDIEFDTGSPISINVFDGSTTTGNIVERVTIENVDISNGGTFIAITASSNGGTINATVRNSTLTNIDIGGSQGAIISAFGDATSGNGTRNVELTALNNTVVIDRAITVAAVQSAAFAATAVAANDNDVNSTMNAQNNIIVSRYSDLQEITACLEFTQVAFGGGTPTATFNSFGGNLTDDPTSCNSLLISTNDQTNASNLASTIGPLQDNGGYTQTMALLTGSPALENGITNALSSDQRGTSRPQGSAFDTGAYELVVSSSSEDEDSESASLVDTGQNTPLITLASISLLTLGGYTIRRLSA